MSAWSEFLQLQKKLLHLGGKQRKLVKEKGILYVKDILHSAIERILVLSS